MPKSNIHKNTIFPILTGSLNQRIPTIAVPAAPIPVNIAYAVPIGIVFIALANKKKLIIRNNIVMMDGTSSVKPCASFKPIAHIISVNPAITSRIHANLNHLIYIINAFATKCSKSVPLYFYYEIIWSFYMVLNIL